MNVPDIYSPIRTLSFAALAAALGFDLNKFKIRKNGHEYYGPCPVHNPTNNATSFSYLSDGKFHCFSCNAKGSGAIDLTKLVKGIGFKEAVSLLEPLVGKQPAEHLAKEKSPVVGDSGASELKPFTGKYDKYAVPCEWLEKRVPDKVIRDRYGVFQYNNPARKSAYSGRVMLPVKDVNNVLYGYLGRNIDSDNSSTNPTPKYLFPPNLPKSKFLFGCHELGNFGQLPLRVVYLVESPFCVMRLAALGFPAVSPFGWSVSEPQLEALQNLAKGIVYLPDRNKYPDCDSVVKALAGKLWVKAPPLPAGIDDPEYLTKDQILAL
jgi:DNA primase